MDRFFEAVLAIHEAQRRAEWAFWDALAAKSSERMRRRPDRKKHNSWRRVMFDRLYWQHSHRQRRAHRKGR